MMSLYFRRYATVSLLALLALYPLPAAGSRFPCITCHADKVLDKLNRTVHMSEVADDCVSCHQLAPDRNHPRDKDSVAVPPQNSASLCYRCHDRESARHTHAPVASGECTPCHAPHRAPTAKLLKMPGSGVCMKCHENESSRYRNSHRPVAKGDCLFCHDPHRSANSNLLRTFGSGLCFDCHDGSLVNGESVHEPAGYGECSACHAVHGSDRRKLLKAAYTEENYLPYARSHYELCFLCHPTDLAEAAVTENTGFRNGIDNLHYLHINKGDRGRSCRVCHDPHAAPQQKLIRDKVPGFGTWDIPVHYRKTPAGGTCVVGCHKQKTYDRVTPVAY